MASIDLAFNDQQVEVLAQFFTSGSRQEALVELVQRALADAKPGEQGVTDRARAVERHSQQTSSGTER